MTEKTAKQAQQDNNHDGFTAVEHIATQLAAIETFIARRFDEISMEINATSQQVDMAEEGIINRFTEILEVLSAISYSGDGTTPANAGVELDAVVDMTEEAANKIIDAATRISALTKDKRAWKTPEAREKSLQNINRDVDEVILACSFQDITGQRIRKTLDNLKHIEERLSTTLNRLGISITPPDPGETKMVAASQEDIDALFGSQDGEKGA